MKVETRQKDGSDSAGIPLLILSHLSSRRHDFRSFSASSDPSIQFFPVFPLCTFIHMIPFVDLDSPDSRQINASLYQNKEAVKTWLHFQKRQEVAFARLALGRDQILLCPP